MANGVSSPPIQLTDLNFAFAKVTIGGHLVNKLQNDSSLATSHIQDDRVLKNINLTVGRGQRVLIVGGNGAGKSTLLGVIAGKHLTADDTAVVFGRDCFRDTTLNSLRTYVSAEWGQRSVAFSAHSVSYTADMAIEEMMVRLQAAYPERRDYLLKVLRIDPKWRLHRLSDGQRRRVQLFLGLIRPSQLIVLDEVLGLLDIISRENVLGFLREETEKRQATVLLATHIFDGTDEWASNVVYIKRGTIGYDGSLTGCTHRNGQVLPMYRVVENWLREELEEDDRIEREAGLAAAGGEYDLSNAQNRAGGYASGRLSGIPMTSLTSVPH